MLRLIPSKEENEEKGRIWYSDNFFDLVFWINDKRKIDSFQLCYNRTKDEKVLFWSQKNGFSHHRIDDGEGAPLKNQSPIFVKDGTFEEKKIKPLFKKASENLPPTHRKFILEKISEF